MTRASVTLRNNAGREVGRVHARPRGAAVALVTRDLDGVAFAFEFVVVGPPQPKQRARVVRVNGKPVAFTPPATVRYERAVRETARLAVPRGWPLDARYGVMVTAYFADGRRRDLDNVLKSCCDACNGVAWADDSQVDRVSIVRAIDRAAPRTVIRAEVLR